MTQFQNLRVNGRFRFRYLSRLPAIVAIAIIVFSSFSIVNADGPTIDVWYGDQQQFGHLGNIQPWVNIVGQVTGENRIATLSYTVNGSAERALTIGPDYRRLEATGDFNIDIHISELSSGANEVVIRAEDENGNETTKRVQIDYVSDGKWPTAAIIEWQDVEHISDAAQVVDGRWAIVDDGVRTVDIGYDRLIAIGNQDWHNYEITVPITINAVDPVYEWPSLGSGVGVMVRFPGHQIWGPEQPAYGWHPFGAYALVSWSHPEQPPKLHLEGNKLIHLGTNDTGLQIDIGDTYLFKVRVETLPNQSSIYSLKVWEDNMPEPASWMLSGPLQAIHPLNGSILLVAHHVDATFGNVIINQLPAQFDETALIEWGAVIAQLPLLLVLLLGAYFLYRHRNSLSRRIFRLGAGALGLIFLQTVLELSIVFLLPIRLHRLGWSTNYIGVTMTATSGVLSALLAVAVALLIWIIIHERKGINE